MCLTREGSEMKSPDTHKLCVEIQKSPHDVMGGMGVLRNQMDQ